MTLKRCCTFFVGLFLLTLLVVPLQTVFAQAEGEAQGGVFGEYAVPPEGRIEVPVEIRDVTDLYAIDIQITFDPAVVQVEDADPVTDGVQPALGTFLDAGLTLFNEVDNENGLIRFVMTQANPSEAKSGDGVVLVLYLAGVQVGESDLEVTFLELSTRAGEAIPVETVSGRVLVSLDAVGSEAGYIPVQDSSGLVLIPTVIPTPIPTESEDALASNAAGDESGDLQGGEVDQQAEGASASDGQSGGFSLVEHWWIVLIVVGLVIGLGIFLSITRR